MRHALSREGWPIWRTGEGAYCSLITMRPRGRGRGNGPGFGRRDEILMLEATQAGSIGSGHSPRGLRKGAAAKAQVSAWAFVVSRPRVYAARPVRNNCTLSRSSSELPHPNDTR